MNNKENLIQKRLEDVMLSNHQSEIINEPDPDISGRLRSDKIAGIPGSMMVALPAVIGFFLLISIALIILVCIDSAEGEPAQSSNIVHLKASIKDSWHSDSGTAALPSPYQYQCIEIPENCLVSQGEMLLVTKGKKLALPLLHTDVSGQIEGFLARVSVTQKFINPTKGTIEAMYTFPLPENAAVDSMIMNIGSRRIVGVIKERSEARAEYERARREGKTASLLEQERPNIFTQSVANILQNDTILITISYMQELKYRGGNFLFNFPMVVGPRYIPGQPIKPGKRGTENPTDEVPDADRITPPIIPPGLRSGHDISLTLTINAGTEISRLSCASHKIAEQFFADKSVAVSIAPNDAIPNKDFVLEYAVAKSEFSPVLLTHRDLDTGFFQLIMLPKNGFDEKEIFARELVFVVDNSGSMQGFPVEKCKEIITLCLNKMRSDDLFRLITFANGTQSLSNNPIQANDENRKRALQFVDQMSGAGGTEMMAAINAIFDTPPCEGRKRLVLFLTDGQIGNDQAIITSISHRLGDARVFSAGIGSAPNRYLIEGMAYAGKGSALFIRQDGDALKTMNDFYSLIDAPVMTDIKISFSGVNVFDALPYAVPDLFAAHPLIITGKYKTPGTGIVHISANLANGKKYSQDTAIVLPGKSLYNASLATLWGRKKIAEYELFGSGLFNKQSFTPEEIRKEITALGLKYRIMSQYTSFVAVNKEVRNKSGKWVSMEQAVELPEGESPASQPDYRYAARSRVMQKGVMGIGAGSGYGSGSGGFSSNIDALLSGVGGLKAGGGSTHLHSYMMGSSPGSSSIAAPQLSKAGSLTGARSRESIMRVVMQNLPSLRYAFKKQKQTKPDLQGTVTVKISIDYSGKVTFCAVIKSTLNDKEFEKIITDKIKTWAFDRIDKKDDITEIEYPFVFFN